ncbi:MAG: ABC transporter ATP-binding protein [Clostridia bacterium]|nr:ABC transporter ATP-binding protein [Clostridia bacterium]
MNNKSTLKKLLSLVKPYWLWVILSLVCSLFTVGSTLFIPLVCGYAIDKMLVDSTDFTAILYSVLVIGAVALLGAISTQLSSIANNKITYGICGDLRNKINKKFQTLPVLTLSSHKSGDLVSRMVADVETVADGLLLGFTNAFTGILTIIAVLVIMFILNPYIALAVLVLTPLSFFTAKFIASKIHKFFESQAKIRGEETALVNELIKGQNIVKSYGHKDKSLADFDEINNRLYKASLKSTFYSSLINPSTRVINNIVYAAVALIGAIFALSTDAVTAGELSIFLSYAGQYAKPFNEISGVIAELQNSVACAKRIFSLLEETDRTPDPEDSENPIISGDVKIENLSFGYSKNKPLLTNISLDVKSGQRVAIVGPTGCGKTTFINLLMRFFEPDEGNIFVDGVNIKNMTYKALRSRFGMVLQDTWLCTGSVKENIAYGNPNATDEDIVNAAKSAYAHSFIMRLPKGYDTIITGNGENLSEGERQLLCIARAMLCLPPILILDEATSSIDTRTEQKIQSAFDKMMKGRTSFVVAHRLSTIQNADIILVMNEGNIVEKGTHQELLDKKGFYFNLYNSQFADE